MKISSFEDLECWQSARSLCIFVFEKTKNTPFRKDFKHVDQINRSSGSAMDNIAEGFGRGGNREFINFLSISLGSSNECKSQLIRAFDRKYLTENKFTEGKELAEATIKKTAGLLTYLRNSNYKGPKFK